MSISRILRFVELALSKTQEPFIFLSTEPTTVYYFTAFASSNATILITKSDQETVEVNLVTDGRYLDQARSNLSDLLQSTQINFQIINQAENSFQSIIQSNSTKEPRLLLEFDRISHANFLGVLSSFATKPEVLDVTSLLVSQRQVKDHKEIEKIARAATIASMAFEEFATELRPGTTEAQAAARLDYLIRINGGEGVAFDTIVASGPNSSFPHAVPTDRPIMTNEPIVVDFGATFEGYRSDCSRTIKTAGTSFSDEVEEVYQKVLLSQEEGISMLRPGVSSGTIDDRCRTSFDEGSRRYFSHGTGHGVGLEIHEAPWLLKGQTTELCEGMVVTVEPGLYYPNQFGIRIEDLFVITDQGARLLTNLTK